MSRGPTPSENDESEIILYTTPDGAVHIEVFFQNESFWLYGTPLDAVISNVVFSIN